MFDIGDIIRDTTPKYGGHDLYGIIFEKGFYSSKPIFHIRLFYNGQIISLYKHEMVKVS